MKTAGNRWPAKLSREFAARLESIPAHQKLHAVILLETGEESRPDPASHAMSPVASSRACSRRGEASPGNRLRARLSAWCPSAVSV